MGGACGKPVLPEAKPLDTSTTSTYVLCPSTTTFVKACREGDAEAAATFLRDGASVDRPEAGMTALMHAADEGHHAVCELLLKAGAQIDAQDPEDGTTALIFSAKSGHQFVALLLLEKGAAVDHQNQAGETALMHSCGNGHVEVTKLLLKSNAFRGVVDRNGDSALEWVAAAKLTENVKADLRDALGAVIRESNLDDSFAPSRDVSIAASRKGSLVDASGPGPLVGGAAYLVPAAGADDATRPSLVADAEETVEDRRRRLSIDEEEPWEEEPARK